MLSTCVLLLEVIGTPLITSILLIFCVCSICTGPGVLCLGPLIVFLIIFELIGSLLVTLLVIMLESTIGFLPLVTLLLFRSIPKKEKYVPVTNVQVLD